MRMDPTLWGQSVAQWLATADVPTITEVIRSYGEDRFAPGIARAIERWRNEHGPLQTTAQLAELVAHTVKSREPGKDPATRNCFRLSAFSSTRSWMSWPRRWRHR